MNDKQVIQIPLDEYEELKEFKDNPGKVRITFIRKDEDVIGTNVDWHLKWEAHKDLSCKIRDLGRRISSLVLENKKLKKRMDELRRMSYWEFREWKKGQE